MIENLKDRKHKALEVKIEIGPKEDENKVLGIAPDLKEKEAEVVDEGQDEKMMRMKDADEALKGNMDESDEIQFERMIDSKEQPKTLLDKARMKMYADKKGYESK